MPGLGYYLQQHRGSTAMVELGCVEMASCTMPSLMPAPYFLTRQKTSPVVDHRYQHSPLFLLHLMPCRPCPFISVQHCFYKAVFLEGFQSAILSKSKNVVTQIFLRGSYSSKRARERSKLLALVQELCSPCPSPSKYLATSVLILSKHQSSQKIIHS